MLTNIKILLLHTVNKTNKMDTNLFINAINQISKDERLLPTHISLYIVLLGFWHENKYQNPINISRQLILESSKIKSKATYHKCIKELNVFGYIKYEPSYNPFKGSLITMLNFTKEINVHKQEPKFESILSTNNKEIIIRISIES